MLDNVVGSSCPVGLYTLQVYHEALVPSNCGLCAGVP